MDLRVFACVLLIVFSVLYVKADRPARCMEPHPVGEGPCRMLISGFYFEPSSEKCEMWSEGGCRAGDGNSYNTMEDCEEDCMK